MSKTKPWPTVANRHRHEAIMKSGEITVAARGMLKDLDELRQAVRSSNIALALAIVKSIELQFRFIQEASQTVITTLESAPSSEEG